MLEEGTGELYVLEVNAIPGLTETSLLPQAADAGRHRLRRPHRADRRHGAAAGVGRGAGGLSSRP
jgi:hypothetical protein